MEAIKLQADYTIGNKISSEGSKVHGALALSVSSVVNQGSSY
jgi:hypothetical protein